MGTTQSPGKTQICEFEGVPVYARKDDDGRPSTVDTIDTDRGKIERLADRLQHLGYGVMRRRHPRAGKVYYSLRATWAADGEPPENPLPPQRST